MTIYCKLKNGSVGIVVHDNNGDESYGVILLSEMNDSMDHDICDSRINDILYTDISITNSNLTTVERFNG